MGTKRGQIYLGTQISLPPLIPLYGKQALLGRQKNHWMQIRLVTSICQIAPILCQQMTSA